MDSIEPIENQTLRLGSEVLSWRVHEYPRHDRGRRWFVISAVFGALLIIMRSRRQILCSLSLY